jgi:hypothetical protein
MGKELGSPITSCPETPLDEKKKDKQPVKLRVSVFFDGTGNNKYNTEERLAHSNKYRFTPGIFSGSYENDYSNVARLYECLNIVNEEFDINEKIYIEGIGTRTKGYDSILGTAMGTGSTGIVNRNGTLGNGKVKAGLVKVFNTVEGKVDKDNQAITLLRIDVFGFSRGAAAARTFIHFAMIDAEHKIKTKLQSEGFSVSQVEVYFSGLFDTVASFGFNHKDDTGDLHLDAISESINVLHLVAKDEHRKNFPLTNIKSKGSKEIFLPGVHSDVGGCYTDFMEEKNLVLMELTNPEVYNDGSESSVPYYVNELIRANEQKLKAEKKRLVNEGWYHELELDISNDFQLIANRKNIRNTYSLLPLTIMKKYSKENGLKFIRKIEITYEISSYEKELNQLMSLITISGEGKYESQKELIKKIRHDYFHSSAHYNSVGMKPNFKNDDKSLKEREVYDG